MLELRFIRENLELVQKKTEFRGIKDSRVEDFAAVDKKRRELLSELEGLRNRRKTVSSEIADLKKQNKDAENLILEMREAGERIKELLTVTIGKGLKPSQAFNVNLMNIFGTEQLPFLNVNAFPIPYYPCSPVI